MARIDFDFDFEFDNIYIYLASKIEPYKMDSQVLVNWCNVAAVEEISSNRIGIRFNNSPSVVVECKDAEHVNRIYRELYVYLKALKKYNLGKLEVRPHLSFAVKDEEDKHKESILIDTDGSAEHAALIMLSLPHDQRTTSMEELRKENPCFYGRVKEETIKIRKKARACDDNDD